MNEFIRRHRAEVIGALSGFDRLRICGTLRLLSYVEGMLMYLGLVKVLLKDLKAYALASTDQIRRATEQLTETLCRPVTCKGRRVRALNPLSAEDAHLLEVVSRGEFAVHGFRNRDVRPLLFGSTEDATRERRNASAITRRLRLLRAHGLIQKVSKTHRYRLLQQAVATEHTPYKGLIQHVKLAPERKE